MSTTSTFADRILNIAITGQVVRIELGSAQIPVDGKGDPQLIPSQLIVMPIDGFVSSAGLMDQVMKKMLENGIIKLRDDAAPEKKVGKKS